MNPAVAAGLHVVEVDLGRDCAELLQELDAEALGHVPSDVAVEKTPHQGYWSCKLRAASPGREHRRCLGVSDCFPSS